MGNSIYTAYNTADKYCRTHDLQSRKIELSVFVASFLTQKIIYFLNLL